jgi:membrane-associated phospholipid phosphatase
MSVSEQIKQETYGSRRLRWMRENLLAYWQLMRRTPQPRAFASDDRPRGVRAALIAAALIACIMLVVDAWSVGAVRRLPTWLIAIADELTDLGRLTWILVPTGALLLLIAVLASPAMSPMSHGVLAAVAVRLSFLFTACALPGLVVTIVKRLIGRGRPLVDGTANPFLYHPMSWNVEYASLPSGHATNAFAAMVAVGALWPRTRPFMWIYAAGIALTRVALTAHFPSDVLVGAFAGMAGALLVRRWFAARRLAFVQDRNGIIRPLPGPSVSRLARGARQLIG